MLGAEVIDQGPGLSIKVALIAVAESRVADQALEREAGMSASSSWEASSREHD